MPVQAWRAWKRNITGKSRWICPKCNEITTFPHKCTSCEFKASEDPALCNTFIRKQQYIYPVFEALKVIDSE